jgi:hypothetical protein
MIHRCDLGETPGVQALHFCVVPSQHMASFLLDAVVKKMALKACLLLSRALRLPNFKLTLKEIALYLLL